MHEDLQYARAKAALVYRYYGHLNMSNGFIVDVGCGIGLMTAYLQEIFAQTQVIGIESNLQDYEIAHQHHPALVRHVDALEHLPFASDTADACIMADILHHVAPEQQVLLVQECMRILKPKGVLIIIELNPAHITTQYSLSICNPASLVSLDVVQKLLGSYGVVRHHAVGAFYCAAVAKMLRNNDCILKGT